jgi:hypothetical protein
MQLLQPWKKPPTRGSLYGFVITVYEVITTPFIVMPVSIPNNSQIKSLHSFTHIFEIMENILNILN